MELPNQLKRIYDAVAWKTGQAIERFVQPTELARQRDGRSEPNSQLTKYVAESEILGNPNALVTSTIPEPDKQYIKRVLKGAEYKDLPVNNWVDWSIKLARSSLVDHALGNFGRASLMIEAMLGDDRIQSAFDGRVKGITKTEPVFVPGKGKSAQKVCDELVENWEEILPEESLEEFMSWAVFEGFCLVEVIWEPWKNQNLWIPRLKPWHPFYVYFRQDIRKYVAITEGGVIEIEPNDPKWLIYTPHGYYRGWLKGRVRSCAIPWLVRQFALRDLARFSEVHGLPMRLAKYPAQAPAEDKARFVAGIRNLGAETTVGLPIQAGPDAAAWGVELVEAKDTSWEAFLALRDACNSSITLAIRGTNLTSEVGTGNSGNRAAAEVHQDEEDDYTMTDRRKVMTMLRKQLFSWYCIFNHGDTECVPGRKSAFVHPEDKDVVGVFEGMQAAAATVVAVRAAGGPIDAEKIYARADIPLIEGREKEANDESKMMNPPKAISEPDQPEPVIPGEDGPPGTEKGELPGKKAPKGKKPADKKDEKPKGEKPSSKKKEKAEQD